jgi:SAM-dependent methyltransferase
MPQTYVKRLKQGPHPDPLDPGQLKPEPATWSARQRHAYASSEMQAYRAGLLLEGQADVRASILDDLSTYFGLSPAECVRRCIDWERWSLEEWQATRRDSPESLIDFYRTTRSWAFDLSWYAYLQTEGFHYPVSVVIARALPTGLRARGGRHLDFGSGVGDAGQLFCRLGFETELADISTSLLAFARFRLERRAEYASYLDLNATTPGPAQYDFITAIDTLVHVPDLPATASMLHRALKPGGYLFTNFDVRPPTPENAWHLYHDDLPLYWQLQRSGFEPVQNLDRRIVCYRRVEPVGLAHQFRGVRDSVLLRSPLRRAYRSTRAVLSTMLDKISG